MHHPDPHLATTLTNLRCAQGWSGRRLAAELGVDHATVSRWEAGRARPSPTLQNRIARLAGATEVFVPVGDEIRDLRLRAGLTQNDFSQRVGITQPTLSRIESGTLRPGRQLAALLREAVGSPFVPNALAEASLAECEASYEAYWRACAVFDRPDGAAWGAVLTRRLVGLAEDDPKARPLLARVYASRAYWALARGRHHDVERMARPAIRHGVEHGFDLTSGYALWAWARSRFNKPRITADDRAVVRSLRTLAQRHTGADLPYAGLIDAAYDRMRHRFDDAEDRLRALADRRFRSGEHGQFGDLTPDQRGATFQSYRAMFRLAAGHNEDVVRLAESTVSDDPVLALILDTYATAARIRLESLAPHEEERLAERAALSGLGFAYETVLDHTERITGARLKRPL